MKFTICLGLFVAMVNSAAAMPSEKEIARIRELSSAYCRDHVDGDIETTTVRFDPPQEDEDDSIEEDIDSKYSQEEQEKCADQIGMYMDGIFVGPTINYDLGKVLEEHGGAPGELEVNWQKNVDAPIGNATDERPLPDADQKYWVYRYGATDRKTYIRVEHAICRFTGTPRAFLEVRGQVYWAPEDFCGKLRRADYYLDDRGFTFEVSRAYCWIYRLTYRCAAPAVCSSDEGQTTCVAAPINFLLAALVGGG